MGGGNLVFQILEVVSSVNSIQISAGYATGVILDDIF